MSNLPPGFKEQITAIVDANLFHAEAEFAKLTESPIELAFGVGFMIVGKLYFGLPFVVRKGLDVAKGVSAPFSWLLHTQKQIGPYRVDFLVEANPPRPGCSVVVECDGHAFHERTKEQAERDRSRDRELQALGHRVFRFTGREIYRSAPDCATEVFSVLIRLLSETPEAE